MEEQQIQVSTAMALVQLYHQTDDEDMKAEIKKAAMSALKALNGGE